MAKKIETVIEFLKDLEVNHSIDVISIENNLQSEISDWRIMKAAVQMRLLGCMSNLACHSSAVISKDDHIVEYVVDQKVRHFSLQAANAMAEIIDLPTPDLELCSPDEVLENWTPLMTIQAMKAVNPSNVWWEYCAKKLLKHYKA